MVLKQLRESLMMTQKELSLKLGISRSTVAMWESGRSVPSVENLKKLSELYFCTIDELVKGVKNEST